MTPITKQSYFCGGLCGQCLVLKINTENWLIIRVQNKNLLWDLYCRRLLVTTTEGSDVAVLEDIEGNLETPLKLKYWPTTPETAVTDTLRLNEQFKQELQK